MEANEYAEAESLFSEMLEKDSELADVMLHRALVRLRLNKLEEALEDVSRFISIRPDNGLGLMLKGEIHLEQKNFDQAYEALYRACGLEKDNGRAFHGLAMACVGLGKKHEAADYLELALQFERDYTLSKCMVEILSKSFS